MKPGFTEFSYGFALTLEIVNALRSSYPGFTMLAPEMPSLKDEGSGKGYDVQLGTLSKPVFIQFKLSNYLIRSTAKGRKAKIYSNPYYSFKLRSKPSNQHEDLLKLENKGEEVYYAAPYFYLQRQFNSNFSSSSIFNNSIFVEPGVVMPKPDGLDHEFCFDGSKNYLFSEPRLIDGGLNGESLLGRLLEGGRRMITPVQYREVFLNILDVAGIEPDGEMANVLRGGGEDYILASARASRMLLGTTMLVVAQLPLHKGAS